MKSTRITGRLFNAAVIVSLFIASASIIGCDKEDDPCSEDKECSPLTCYANKCRQTCKKGGGFCNDPLKTCMPAYFDSSNWYCCLVGGCDLDDR